MRVFVTGATGFIGSAIVRELLAHDHQVIGLARSAQAADRLTAAGVTPHRGSIEDLDSLRAAAARADGAVHTAFFHQFTHAGPWTRARILLGGSPGRIGERFMGAMLGTDRAAIEAIGTSLRGPDRPLVAAFGTMAMTPGRTATEDDEPDPQAAGGARGATERTMLDLAERGVRTSVVRLAPAVHDDARRGLVGALAEIARARGVSGYLGEGAQRWPALHVADAARLLRLAVEGAPAGSVLHGTAEEGVPLRAIAEAVGRHLDLPVAAVPAADAAAHFGWLAGFLALDAPASSALTQQLLGWRPVHPTLLADLDRWFTAVPV